MKCIHLSDLINYLNTTDEDVCLIAIDYARLSTNVDDLYQFVKYVYY